MTGPVRLWIMSESIASAARRFELGQNFPPRFEVANRADFFDRALEIRAEHPELSQNRLQALIDSEPFTPHLRAIEPDFAPHLFVDGAVFVSSALRAAASLLETVVRCGPVDSSQCIGLARDRDYRTWEPLLSADPVDHVLSDAQLCRWTESIEDGVRVGRWGPIVDPNAPASRIALLSYFEPPAPLFAMDGPIGGGMIVTEELAERVVAAGIEDIEFIRIDGERGRTENEYRPST